MKRITLIVGHYGSGKTEFSVNHVINLKKQHDKVAILDMDIANPYFRSRERQEFLEDMGIAIHFNSFGLHECSVGKQRLYGGGRCGRR